MKICSRCVLPETYPNISFDEESVCNFCQSHQSPVYQGKEALIKRINKLRNPLCPYDAILGLSGGRDSTFAAYYVVKELGLKIFAFTFDNGFMPEMTWQNIQNTVQVLGIDHRVINSHDMKSNTKRVLKALTYKSSPAMAAFLCSGCDTGLSQGYDQISNELDCKLVISGGGEPENTFAEYLLTKDTTRRKSSLIKGFIGEALSNPSYLNPLILSSFSKEFFNRFTHKAKNYSSIALFRYIEWDEELILKTITQELNWQIPDKMVSSWRSDCKVNVIRQYIYQELLGFSKNTELLSQLIRNGRMTRDKALSRLELENKTDLDLLSDVLSELGVSLDQLNQGLQKAKQSINN